MIKKRMRWRTISNFEYELNVMDMVILTYLFK